MSDINKLLEERGKVHGDYETTHSLAYSLFKTLDDHPDNKLKPSSRAMLFLDIIKTVRGIQCPSHDDHWRDKAGYSTLIGRAESDHHK